MVRNNILGQNELRHLQDTSIYHNNHPCNPPLIQSLVFFGTKMMDL